MGMPHIRQQGGRDERVLDGGFSLVEIVVAMLLLTVIALAIAPLLITATASSVQNRDSSAANSVANARVAELKARFPDSSTTTSCASVLASSGGTDASTGLTTTLDFPGGCPADYPGTVTVEVIVTEGAGAEDSLDDIVTVSTELLVSAS
ncbi:prepilin-type N-terminal cleavage/methylation domain-containing protein [Microbacterium sp. LRZ72]|uniref:type IV pilus modification PilV family protein n=1 Tax=Microbacterium sp. LRZ72 TaxID=2942481 RepID=UPI0029BD19C9|nr:prepilin-type N-terminal cleavage/methylation domain-containing protein [Microbacterium sp. LRZ72]MDX2377123.1 prepilin-type N-terminal cleavage/methylation domain-containing protein [Microbacterium sp. LRZ72]